ncbi:MAG: hypothetical protein AABP62_14965 [Planctomycetota bacterium]
MSGPEHVNLQFEDSGRWYSLPEWAEYFIGVGSHVARASNTDSRIVTAIVVPTRAFGAAFVSLGMIISDSAARDQASESAHFEMLFDLAPGTPVILRPKKGTALKGVLQSPEEYRGQLWVRVQVHSKEGGGRTYLIDESHGLTVQPAGRLTWKLPKTQGMGNDRTASKFVDSLLGEADPIQLGVKSKIVCALVGRRNTLEHEIRGTPLSIRVNGDQHAEGQLQDILRVDSFVTEQQSHRSALVTVGTSRPAADVINNVEIGVVFDGALGFLKLGAIWPPRHQVIILDRTEPYFDDAISAINSRFTQTGLRDECGLPDIEPPPGGEILAFREDLQ